MKSKLAMSTAIVDSGTPARRMPRDEKFWNPKPLADDVILPMPCDGAMAFRKVAIPLNKPLEDYNITLGQEGDDWGYVEQSRQNTLQAVSRRRVVRAVIT